MRRAESVRAMLAPGLEEGDMFRVTDAAPAAPPSLDHPLLARLVTEAGGGGVSGKLGWTDVAFFAERGVPAANFGPGDPELAHSAGEKVTRASLERARSVLGRSARRVNFQAPSPLSGRRLSMRQNGPTRAGLGGRLRAGCR